MNPAMPDPSQPPDRLVWIVRCFLFCICLGMAAIVVRVGLLQVAPPPQLSVGSVDTFSRATIPARRGALRDRRGRVIASTHLGYRVFADPQLIVDWGTFALQVAAAIDDDPIRIERVLSRNAERRYAILSGILTDEQLTRVQLLELKGLAIEPRPVRVYPQSELASQLVGFVGSEHTGLDGLEFALNGIVDGSPGRLEVSRDVRQRALWIEQAGFESPSDGVDIRLSIDSVIQKIAEEELAATGKKHRAKTAEAVVMDPATGQILAMANWPPFDPADLSRRTPAIIKRNRCVTDPFEPGSIFKPFVHAAATEARAVGLKEMIDCTEAGFWVTSYGRRLRDAHGHGTIDWGEVLIYSSNIGMGKIGQRLGARRLDHAVRSFGFGELSGVALPGESRGIVNPLRSWTKYSLTSVPMGQEIAVTPVQLVKGFSAFANKGLVAAPSILADETSMPLLQRAVDAASADATKHLMRRVVTEGTGRNAKSDKYQIWGKTGTAQIPELNGRGYRHRAYTASFICGAPLDRPRIVVLVSVHEPDPNVAHYGGIVAAPWAKNIIERTLTYLAVEPDAPDPASRPLDQSLVSVTTLLEESSD